MGRRKSKRKPPPKKKMTGNLDTQFTCPFCNHEKSCDVKMERTRNTGIISCSVCLEEFQTPITCILPLRVTFPLCEAEESVSFTRRLQICPSRWTSTATGSTLVKRPTSDAAEPTRLRLVQSTGSWLK
ncbi:transcription elongation factor 1 homolog isoform X1 [Synchiropus splendidus]|uniref:transcription elongation factor 1 homolog isoform X1 n=1 Tax=Synchiropus splendidus TaxID=270530 RepID=UPI00237E62F0|nr:transcription elongation factor 1 homolog isoform X1 [Synchiropus splendidus]